MCDLHPDAAAAIREELTPLEYAQQLAREARKYKVPARVLEKAVEAAKIEKQAEKLLEPHWEVIPADDPVVDHRFRLKMMRHGTWYVSSRLWVLLVGDVSVKKPPSTGPGTRPLPSTISTKPHRAQ